jgi:hypothetical protein
MLWNVSNFTSNNTRTEMTDTQKLQFLLTKLKETAQSKHCYEEYGDDYSPSESGSYDDAFDAGFEYGEITFARELLQKLNFQVQIEPHLK